MASEYRSETVWVERFFILSLSRWTTVEVLIGAPGRMTPGDIADGQSIGDSFDEQTMSSGRCLLKWDGCMKGGRKLHELSSCMAQKKNNLCALGNSQHTSDARMPIVRKMTLTKERERRDEIRGLMMNIHNTLLDCWTRLEVVSNNLTPQ